MFAGFGVCCFVSRQSEGVVLRLCWYELFVVAVIYSMSEVVVVNNLQNQHGSMKLFLIKPQKAEVEIRFIA